MFICVCIYLFNWCLFCFNCLIVFVFMFHVFILDLFPCMHLFMFACCIYVSVYFESMSVCMFLISLSIYLHVLFCICLCYICLFILLFVFAFMFLFMYLGFHNLKAMHSLLRDFTLCKHFVVIIILARISPLLFDVAVTQRHQKSWHLFRKHVVCLQ